MNRNAKLLIGLACVSSVLTACKEDYFDIDAYDAKIMYAFPVDSVGADQTWAVYGSAKACIAVAGDASETYTVEVYKEDPTVSKSLTLLATGTASGLNNVTLQFSYELASPTVYVSLYNKAGRRWTQKATAVDGGEVCLGFLGAAPPAGRTTRSQSWPSVPDITAPYDATWVSNYLNSATEPDTEVTDDPRWNNTTNNHDHGYWTYGSKAIFYSWIGDATTLAYNPKDFTGSEADREFFETYCRPYHDVKTCWDGSKTWADYYDSANEEAATLKLYEILSAAGKWNSWVNGVAPSNQIWVPDEKFVTNFKIVGTYSGTIPVAASEGYAKNEETGEYGDRLDPFLARTIVVTGTWIITDDQRMGSGSLIVIANGGQVIVSSGKKLETVNHARIVVLSGGILTGPGTVEVSNGNGIGEENYNAGNISVDKFNNNFGKFYNYGKFLVSEYVGGAKESNFYNHGLVHIKYTGLNNETPNARIYNECQWYCENNMRCRIYEGTQGSSFIIGGQLMMSVSADGTSDPTYVGLDDGALVKCGELYNNATSWTGPTSGRAVVSIGKIVYLNWTKDQNAGYLSSGYFENNIYVEIKDDTNVPEGNADSAGGNTTAGYRFWNIVANGLNGGNAVRGNGGVSKVTENNTNEIIPASDNFSLGSAGCTPGYKGVPDVTEDRVPDNQPKTPQGYRFCFEDNFPSAGDYDFNDCVMTVTPVINGKTVTVTISLDAVGATKQIAAALRIKNLYPYSLKSVERTGFTDDAGVYSDFSLIKPVELFKVNGNAISSTVYTVSQLGRTLDPNAEIPTYPNYNNINNETVISLFNDANWAISGEGSGANYLALQKLFFNTIDPKLNHMLARQVAPKTMTLTFEYHDWAEDSDLQIFNDVTNYDLFIVEYYDARPWEVHTYPFKFDQVLGTYAQESGKLEIYARSRSAKYPWAIQVPASFKYPLEWQSISGAKIGDNDTENYGTAGAAYSQFKFWAADPSDEKYKNWYETYDSELVYP